MKSLLGLTVLLLSLTTFSFSAKAQWRSSSTSCYAYTDCYANNIYQGRVSCRVYGSAHSSVYGVSSSGCTWQSIANYGVQCKGYVKSYDRYSGSYFWAWQTYTYKCPGRY